MLTIVIPVLIGFGAYEIVLKTDGMPQRLGKNYSAVSEIDKKYESIKKMRFNCYDWNIDKCRSGNIEAERKVLLAGDSFASNYWGFADVLAKDANASVDMMVVGNCPLIDTDIKIDWFNTDECLEMKKKAFEYIGSKKYEVVMLGGIWSRSAKLLKDEYYTGLESTIKIIIESGVTPVFIYNHYDAGKWSVYDPLKIDRALCARRHIAFPSVYKSCDIVDGTAALQDSSVIDVMNNLKNKYPELEIVNIYDLQCTNGMCRTEINGYPVYADDDGHITDYASYMFGKEFLEINKNPLK